MRAVEKSETVRSIASLERVGSAEFELLLVDFQGLDPGLENHEPPTDVPNKNGIAMLISLEDRNPTATGG
jgi:hypothetical protein